MSQLKNKTAIVTGSSRGLGKKTAIELSKKGANVIINYNASPEEANSVVQEIGNKGITVNSVLPGPLNTELFRKDKPQELIDRIANLSAFGRIGEVDDIVSIISFLASEKSQWITGQNFGINGGMA